MHKLTDYSWCAKLLILLCQVTLVFYGHLVPTLGAWERFWIFLDGSWRESESIFFPMCEWENIRGVIYPFVQSWGKTGLVYSCLWDHSLLVYVCIIVPPQLNAAILTELKLVEKNSSKYKLTACKTLRMQNSTHVNFIASKTLRMSNSPNAKLNALEGHRKAK